ncbi:MAG: ATP-binding cassette domain-containing protein, partial [Microvirga sp.]
MIDDEPVKPLFNRSQTGPSDVSLLEPHPVGSSPHAFHRAESEAAFGGPGILAVKGLQKSYRGRTVVQDAGLNVRAGEAVGLLGPNGAGKTTIFYMITGLVGADRGVISLDGHDVTSLPMYRRARLGIGYLPQEASIFRGLNVEDNIRAVLEIVEPSRKERERKLDALLDEFNITRLRKSPSIALSGGERRRCEIARALAGEPVYHGVSRTEGEGAFGGAGVLAVKGLQKSYRGRTVVQDAGLQVRAGEAVGLLGPNGAGKTTIFYMITGLVGADRGVISLDGHDVTGLPMYRRARLGIGYLPQEASIFRGLNVEDNIRAV